MNTSFTNDELKKMYQILKAFNEGLIVNPSEEWELDYYDKSMADRKGLNTILKKIEDVLPDEEREGINKDILRRRYDTFNNQIDETVYSIVEKAYNDRKTVEIGYFDMKSADVNARQIDVYHKTRRYVIAYCHLRKDMRKFRTSRIVSAKLANKTYIIPENFDKNNYL